MRRLLLVLPVLLALIAFARVGGPAADAGVPPASSMLLDCDTATAGVQSSCLWLPGTSRDVDIVIRNDSGASIQIGIFTATVLNPDNTRLSAPAIDANANGFNGNPDTNATVLPGAWSCGVLDPVNDTGADMNPATQQSFIDCLNGGLDGAFIAPGATLKVATVHYNVSPMPQTGSVALSIQDGGFYDATFVEVGSCDPTIAVAMTCSGATITLPQLTMSLDCNTALAGVQSTCHVSNMGTTRDVDVVLRNNGSTAFNMKSFGLYVLNPDVSRLFAPDGGSSGGSWLDSNPDFIAEAPPSGWACGPGGTDNDADGDDFNSTQQSTVSCFISSSQPGPLIMAAGSLAIARVHYDIVAGADPGPISLSLTDASVYDGGFNERGSCNPTLAVPMLCNSATVNFYCPIDLADVSGDNYVNILDVYMTALQTGVLPAPAQFDQNFDGVINVADRGIVSSFRNKPVSLCP